MKIKELGHSCSGVASIERDVCDECGIVGTVLSVDTSDGEYGHVSYCLACITKEFQEHAAISDTPNKETP